MAIGDYIKTQFINNEPPAINSPNLNNMENKLDEIDKALGTAATRDVGTAANQLPRNQDLPTYGTAADRDVGTGSTQIPDTTAADGRYARRANNLNDLSNVGTARTNLGLTSAATTAAATAATANTLILRDGSGRAQVAEPSANADIATKQYVDSQASGPTNVLIGTGLPSGALGSDGDVYFRFAP